MPGRGEKTILRDGNETEPFCLAGLEAEESDGVLRAVANEQRLAGSIEGQRVGLRTEQICGILPCANRLDDLIRARVDDVQGVAAGVGHDEPAFVWRKRQRTGVKAGQGGWLIVGS